ncbi:MAG: WecB/TagA/CpsF family glycosyltransferase [Thermomicrobiales bacterium]
MASADQSAPIEILGVSVNATSEADAIAWIDNVLATNGRVCQLATYNPEYAIKARRNTAFAAALRRCELVTADGIGISLAARLRGRSIERVTGVRMLQILAATGAPIFLLGAGPNVADLAAERLREAESETRIVGVWSDGTPDPALDAEAIGRIRESGAHVVAVVRRTGPGALDRAHRVPLSEAGVRIAVGVGGALDYWSGLTPTPPAAIRRFGLEWLWRLVREPKRWRRQLALPQFAALAGMEAATERIRRARHFRDDTA